MGLTSYIILGLPALILIWGIVTYNRFISLRRYVDEAWSGIAVQLKRRHDLVPNLVATVQGYADHEQSVLTELTRLRGAAVSAMNNIQGGAADVAKLAASEGSLTAALGRLFAVAEAYPTLQANKNFLGLQHSLQEIEEQLQFARRYYNGTVRGYSILRESFPSLIIANIFNFAELSFFELDNQTEAAVPTVSFEQRDQRSTR